MAKDIQFNVKLVSTIAGQVLTSSTRPTALAELNKNVSIGKQFFNAISENINATISTTIRQALVDLLYDNAAFAIDSQEDPDSGVPYKPLSEGYAINKAGYLRRIGKLQPLPKYTISKKRTSKNARLDRLAKQANTIELLQAGLLVPILVANGRMLQAIERKDKALVEAPRTLLGKAKDTFTFTLNVPGAPYFRFHQTGTVFMPRRKIFNQQLTQKMLDLILNSVKKGL